ncbi:MAG: hypothetical protein SGPRY_008655, partial [Prymnesium sp.]
VRQREAPAHRGGCPRLCALVEKPPVQPDDVALERRWLVPMRLPADPPPSAQDVWPPYQPREGEAQLSVLLEMRPARAPPGGLEQSDAFVQLPPLARERRAERSKSSAPRGGGTYGELAARLSEGLPASGAGVEVLEERVDQIVQADVDVPVVSEAALAHYAALTTRSDSLDLEPEASGELRLICFLLLAEAAAAPEEAERAACRGAQPSDLPADMRDQSNTSWCTCCPGTVGGRQAQQEQLVPLGKGRPRRPAAERCLSRVLTSLMEHAHVSCAYRRSSAAERAVDQLAKVARAVRLGVQAAWAERYPLASYPAIHHLFPAADPLNEGRSDERALPSCAIRHPLLLSCISLSPGCLSARAH